MARELGEVLHYFLDDASQPPGRREEPGKAEPCPIVAAPLHPRDPIRTALLWSLAAEMRALGRAPTLLAPEPQPEHSAWLDLACEAFAPTWVPLPAGDVGPLLGAAADAAATLPQESGSVVLVHVPSDRTWNDAHTQLFSRCWLVAGASDADRREFLELCERVLSAAPRAQVGVTVRGAETLAEARGVFDGLAELFAARFERPLTSYGLLVDELELARSLVEGPARGEGFGCTRAARALRDVALLLRDDLH